MSLPQISFSCLNVILISITESDSIPQHNTFDQEVCRVEMSQRAARQRKLLELLGKCELIGDFAENF